MQTFFIQPTPFGINCIDQLMCYLFDCLANQQPARIEYHEEASSSHTTGLYQILDNFCNTTGYKKSDITINTGNLKEAHNEYNIEHNLYYWQDYAKVKINMHQFDVGNDFSKHFGNFVGRSSWSRLWIGSELFNKHKEKTLQTYHTHLQCNYYTREQDGVYDDIGLEDLNQMGCKDLTGIARFLNSCPITIEDEKYQYPMHYPANLNIVNFYKDIFVDIVTECYVDGPVFALTEKTWRPMACRRPFVLMSSRLSLQNLQSIGFKTFSQWWDESYDDYEGADRVEQILDVVNTISQWSIEECKQHYADMHSVLDHNYNLLSKLTDSDLIREYQ